MAVQFKGEFGLGEESADEIGRVQDARGPPMIDRASRSRLQAAQLPGPLSFAHAPSAGLRLVA